MPPVVLRGVRATPREFQGVRCLRKGEIQGLSGEGGSKFCAPGEGERNILLTLFPGGHTSTILVLHRVCGIRRFSE